MFLFELDNGRYGCITIHSDEWEKEGRITFAGVPQSLWRELEESIGLRGNIAIHEGRARASDLKHALERSLEGTIQVTVR
jgi:hypothetical protein